MSDGKPSVRLGYWKIRGLAQPIRCMLKYLKVDFADELYEQGDAPEYSREAWLSVKPTIDVDFPNLPYFMDGHVKLTQSLTILRYVARKYGVGSNLYEGTPEQLAAVDLMIDQTVDLRQSVSRTAYGGMPYETFKTGVLPGYLDGLEKVFAKDGRKFAAGCHLTIADFVLHEVLEQVEEMVAELSKEDAFAVYPSLKDYVARFEAVPAIAEYRKSAEFMPRPFNNKIGVWK